MDHAGKSNPGDTPPTKGWASVRANKLTKKEPDSFFSAFASFALGEAVPGSRSDEMPYVATAHAALKPRLERLLSIFKVSYSKISKFETEADELELFHETKRVFHDRFTKQERMLPVKVYKLAEHPEDDQEALKARRPSHRDTVYVKEANWLAARSVFEERDVKQQSRAAVLERYMTGGLDALLKAEADFVAQQDIEYTVLQLKRRAESMQEEERESIALAVASHPEGDIHTAKIWAEVYRQRGHMDMEDSMRNGKGGEQARRKAEEKATGQNGSLQSYMHLRFLHTRDEQQHCRNALNYFRSVERTMTLDLAATNDKIGRGFGVMDSFVADLEKLDLATGVDNHDDYFKESEDGHNQVIDSAGIKIMYDVAKTDYSKLAQELLALGTHFIQKRAGENEKKPKRKSGKLRRWGSDESIASVASHTSHSSRASHASHTSRISAVSRATAATVGSQAGDDEPKSAAFDMAAYIQNGVDRAAILMDLWACEAEFQNAKVNLTALYVNAYLHMYNTDARKRIAQVIKNLSYYRPPYDLEADYFVKAYRTAIILLKRTSELITKVLSHIKETQRQYAEENEAAGHESRMYGMRPRVQRQGPILLHSTGKAEKDTMSDTDPAKVYIFEHHQAMAFIVDVYNSLQFAASSASRVLQPTSAHEALKMEIKLVDIAHSTWDDVLRDSSNSLNLSGHTASVYDARAVQNPAVVVSVADAAAEKIEMSAARELARNTGADVATAVPVFGRSSLSVYSTMIEIITVRHRLMRTFRETLELNKTYMVQATAIGLDEGLAYMRPVSFDRLRGFSAGEQDSYVPGKQYFAVQEILEDSSPAVAVPMDTRAELTDAIEGSLGKVANEKLCGNGVLGKLRCILEAQVAARDAAVVGVDYREIRHDPSGDENERVLALLSRFNLEDGLTTIELVQQHVSFLSIQATKTTARAEMSAEYVKRKASSSSKVELEREMLRVYCQVLTAAMGQNAMRIQMARYAGNTKRLLDMFPSTRDYYFQLGEQNQTVRTKRLDEAAMEATMENGNIAMGGILKNKENAEQAAYESEKQERSPLEFLTADGKRLRNPWYMPYDLEFTTMHAHLDTEERDKALTAALSLTYCIHDILMILCAHARVGSSHARLGTMDTAFVGVGADWGGTEGIGAELRQLRRSLGKIADPGDPAQVQHYLDRRRQIIHLEWVLTVKYYVRETFLAKSNESAYGTVTANTRTGLTHVVRTVKPRQLGFGQILQIPASAGLGSTLFPWRTSLQKNGPYAPGAFLHEDIGTYLELCLTNLNEVERHIANGEVLGISLLVEDILDQRQKAEKKAGNVNALTGESSTLDDDPLTITEHTHSFLLASTIMEKLKYTWCERTLGIEINTEPHYRAFGHAYDTQIVAPVVRHLLGQTQRGGDDDDDGSARRQQRSTAGLLVGHGTALQLHGIPELTYRQKLVEELRKHLECLLINGTRAQVRQEYMALVSETQQTDGTLPTDIWATSVNKAQSKSGTLKKKAGIIQQPNELMTCKIAQEFSLALKASAAMDGGKVVFERETLRTMLASLGSAIVNREKQAYMAYAHRHRAIEQQFQHLLTQKEDEVRAVQAELKERDVKFEHRLECTIADRTRHMISEITALRAKVSRMHAELETQENVVRERVKRDYDDLVHSLFSTSFALKNRFEEYRSQLYEDVVSGIGDVRKTAINRMKLATVGKTQASLAKYGVMHSNADSLRDTQSENAMLSGLVLKMRTMNDWKRTGVRSFYGKKIWQANQHAAAYKKAFFQVRLAAQDLEVQAAREITALRKQLGNVKTDKSGLRQTLQDERQKRLALQQWKAQKMQMLLQVEDKAAIFERIKHLDIEKALHDLETMDDQLQAVRDQAADSVRTKDLSERRLRAEVKQLRAKLNDEIRIKTSAVLRMEDSIEFGSPPDGTGADWNRQDMNSLINAIARDSASTSPSKARLPRPGSASGGRPGSASRSRPSSARPTGSPKRPVSGNTRRPNSARTLSRPSTAGNLHTAASAPIDILDESVTDLIAYGRDRAEARGNWF